MLHFKTSTLIRWSAENSQLSLNYLKKRKRARVYQAQSLRILTNSRKPKMTVGAIVVPEVFGSRIPRIKVDIQLVVYDLTRISNAHAEVRDVFVYSIFITFDCIRSFDWTSNGNPIRRNIGRITAYI